ncbi:adenylate/guanylate cyclase domain-containing protein, partial [Brevibacterium paucivorans]
PDPRTRALPQINEHTVFSRPDAPWNRDATATTEIQRIAETSEEFSSSFQEERARANARSSDDSSVSELRDRLEFSQGLADDPNPPTEAVPDLLDNPELIEQRIQRLRAAASLLE